MTKQEIVDEFHKAIAEIKTIIVRRGWELRWNFQIEQPATKEDVASVERELGFKLPQDLCDLFILCARKAHFLYQMKEEPPAEFSGIFSGMLDWELARLPEMYQGFLDWVEVSIDPMSNDPDAIDVTQRLWKNKVPFMEVPNGDIIVVGNNPSEVVYFSHEGDEMHGKVLANSLFEFVLFLSRVGFIGNEDWQFQPFYNFTDDKMETNGPKVERFSLWLRTSS